MNIENKIRKRIKTAEMLKCEHIDEIQITKEEAEQLGARSTIDGVKLIIVDKLGDMSKKDCFAYIDRNGHKSCYCLDNLYCKNQACNFYRNDISIEKIEERVELYAVKK